MAMAKFPALLWLNFRALLATMRVGRKKRSFSGIGALALLAGLSIYISGVYSSLLAGQLATVGALPLLLVLMSLVAVILGFFFSLFAAQGVVFGAKDNDLMLALPISPFVLMLSRTLALYLENLVSTVFVLLPAGVIYLWYGGPGGWPVLPLLLLSSLFLNLLPTLLTLIVGFVLAWLAGRFPRKALASSLAQLVLLALLLVGSIWLSTSMHNVGTAVPAILTFFQGWGRPFLMLANGVSGGDLLQLLALYALCLIPFLAVVWLFAWQYKSMITRLSTHRTRSDYKLGKLSASGQRGALLRKEARRWFGTPSYVFNTGIGLLMLPGAGIAALIYRESIAQFLTMARGLSLAPLLMVGIGFCLSTVAITGSSISLEGKQLWLLQCAPVPVTTILGMKVVFQLLVVLPFLVVSWVMLSLAFALSPVEWVLLLADSLLFALLCAPFGLWINLHFPKLDAVNDVIVVKQSASAMLSTFLPMVLVLAFFLLWVFAQNLLGSLGMLLLYGVVLAAAALVFLLLFIRQGERLFHQLSD